MIVRGVGATGNAASLSVLAPALFSGCCNGVLPTDFTSFAVISADALKLYEALDRVPDGPGKDEAKKRLFANPL